MREGGKLGVRRCGPSRRLVPHARLHITGHGEAKAGAWAAAVMPSATLRRTGAARAADQLFGRCTLHVPSARRPLTACQELPPTAAATPHLHALVAVPPLPRVPARAPAARRLAIAEQCLLLSGLGSELGAGFRAGGRAVNLGCKRLLSKEKIETCRALSKRGRPKTVVCREMMFPAHALLKQASSQGVIAARADLRVHVHSSGGALASIERATSTHDSSEASQDCESMS